MSSFYLTGPGQEFVNAPDVPVKGCLDLFVFPDAHFNDTQQFGIVKGFGQVVVGTEHHPFAHVGDVCFCRKEDKRDRG